MMSRLLLYVSLFSLLILSGCVTPGEGSRLDLARSVADQTGLQRQIVATGNFDITTFTRFTAPDQPVTVYIEGDGLAWKTRRQPSGDPSPTDPIGLRLAAADTSSNVIYMARPCQYTRGAACDVRYWTGSRFAPEIIEAMNKALNTSLNAHMAKGVRLVGFSGGGAVAALMAARRSDVIDLRTIAGNLDPTAHSALHNVSALDGSLNPINDAAALRSIPQQHFVGEDDDNVPEEIYASYAAALAPTSCVHMTIVPGMSHEDDWDAQWQTLQTIKPACAAGSIVE